MPLSNPVARKALHKRSIICDGYEREDGLWDIEVRMEDIKHYGFDNKFRGHVNPGEPLHEMYLRVTLNNELTIEDIEAKIDNYPFVTCPNIVDDYRKLIGVKIGVGWRRAIKERVGGKMGCTHMTEMMQPLATVAIQTIMPTLLKRREEAAAKKAKDNGGKKKKNRPIMLDSCHSWASDSAVVKEYSPDFYTGDDKD